MRLNDDCLICIFELLDLEDQISAARAYWRFHNVMCYLWRRLYVDFDLHMDGPRTEEDLIYVLDRIYDTIKNLTLRNLGVTDWYIIQSYVYPSVVCLDLLRPVIISDQQVLKMTKIFPNLQSFNPRSQYVSGKYVANWKDLKVLNLSHCSGFKFDYFEQILEQVELTSIVFYKFCKTFEWKSERALNKFCKLENITMRSEEWLLDLSQFPNLKTLDLRYLRKRKSIRTMLQSVNDHKHSNLVRLRVGYDSPFDLIFINPYQNLMEVILCSRNEPNVNEILYYAPNLREISLIKCNGVLPEDVLILLEKSKLEFISVEACYCEFINLTINVKNVVQYRKVPLHFNFAANLYKIETSNLVNLEVFGQSYLFHQTQGLSKWLPDRNFLFEFR